MALVQARAESRTPGTQFAGGSLTDAARAEQLMTEAGEVTNREVKDIARIVTASKTRDDDQKKKYSDMVKTLIDEYGYNEHSAEEILTYASNNLWRDS